MSDKSLVKTETKLPERSTGTRWAGRLPARFEEAYEHHVAKNDEGVSAYDDHALIEAILEDHLRDLDRTKSAILAFYEVWENYAAAAEEGERPPKLDPMPLDAVTSILKDLQQSRIALRKLENLHSIPHTKWRKLVMKMGDVIEAVLHEFLGSEEARRALGQVGKRWERFFVEAGLPTH